jgi:outer membrane receptor protein involved in Fe transport
MKKLLLTTTFLFALTAVIFSQTINVTGKVTNEKNEPVANASVRVKNGTTGTTTDAAGKFSLSVASLPVTLLISHTEKEEMEVLVSNDKEVNVRLSDKPVELGEVKVEGGGNILLQGKFINVPITTEIVGKTEIRNAPGAVYDIPVTKKGLDVTVSSLTYRTYSTRGFNGSGSSRVNQIMDGMDNQAPGLNFAVGNFAGPADLDIESIEILHGASSALYGPGGVNGTIILNTKNPFKSEGLSLQIKNGITDIGRDQRPTGDGFMDYSFRYAKSFNDKIALKVGVQYMQANDWLANDSTNYKRNGAVGNVVPGNRITDPNYDGVNIYGDETSVDIRAFMQAACQSNPAICPIVQPFLVNPQLVSRTGYSEKDLVDPKTKNLRINGALHYKVTKNIEAIFAGHWGSGNTVYSGNGRYAFKDVKIGQYKLELRHKNWFIRGFTTQEDAGEAYSAGITAQLMNEGWKRSYNPSNVNGSWYPQYTGAFLTGAGQIFQQILGGGGSLQQAQAAVLAAASQLHIASRSFADQGRPVPGSSQFTSLFNTVRKTPIPAGGLFQETSQLWMGEGQYNFADKIKFADITIGGNVKKYILDSKNTLFYEPNGAIKINEWGGYVQAAKKFFEEKLTLTAAGRYDKNENFDGKFTPRITALISVAKNNNIRMSYQTAYKFPTTQQQWINLDIGSAILLGGLPWIDERMNIKTYPTFVVGAQPVPYTYKQLKPESMRSFELGYKGSFNNKLLLDMYVYFGKYTDFTGRILLVQPTNNNKIFSIVSNSETDVKAWGAGIGLDYKMAKNFFSFFNFSTDELTNVPTGFMAQFNTPKYRMNAGFGNSGLGKGKRIGFNINLRWQDAFYWEGAGLADGNVDAYTTLDAQVNYKFTKMKTMMKIGGTNITNKFYQTGFANPYIGGLYYLSFIYNL